MPAARLHLYLFGLFRLLQDNQPVAGFDQPRLQQLLAYLVLHRATPISRQQLAFLFWPDSTDQQARKNLRTLLTRLRRVLPDADCILSVTSSTIQWRSDALLKLDMAEFEAAVAQAVAAQARGQVAAAADAFAAAIAAYTGELLPDCYDDWILPLRERTHQAYGNALERLVLLLEEQRQYATALPYAQRLLEHDPLHEPAYRHLMHLHLALGSRADASRIYDTCVRMLQREFGIAPARTTQNIYQHLISTDDRPGTAAPGPSPETGPADRPLAGRKAEWARLVAAWRAAAAGSPQMLLLTGEAGIGKTHLAEELYAWVVRQGFAAAAAHCAAGSAALPYAPVAEWLNEASLHARLASLEDAWLVEVARIVPALLAERPHLTPAGPLTEAWQRTRLFEALARALLGSTPGRGRSRPIGHAGTLSDEGSRKNLSSPTASSGQVPLLLFLDDLQWVDRETLDWLGYLLRFDLCAPLLVVSAIRQHEVGQDHPLTAFRLELVRSGLLSEVPLSPLDAAETTILATEAAGRELAAAEAAQIYHDSEGNPLFIVEMVRAGMTHGGTGQQGDTQGRGQGEGDLGPSAHSSMLPPRVRAMVQWRLAMLSPAAQTVAQAAAVLGRQFSFDALVRSSDQDEAKVVQGLDELWQRHLVRAQGINAYDFSHDGIRAVAYDEIGPARRRALHLRVARALEEIHDEDLDGFSGQIAAHYEQAGQVQPAIRFYRRAAAAAQAIYANDEAVRLYSHLLEGELGISLSEREKCETMLALAQVWRVTGRWVRARTIIQQAVAAAEAFGDARLQAQAQCALADVLRLLGYYDEALGELARAEERFQAVGDGRGVVSALWTMGQIHWFRGELSEALAVLERQLQIATGIDDQSGICEALETMGMVYWSQGDWERSAGCCLESILIAEPLDYKQTIARASITLGNVRSSEHWFGEAVHWYQRAGVLAREIDDRQALSWATSNIALVLAKRGDYVRARSGYERSLRNAWEIGDRWTACLNVAGLGSVIENLGQLDLAENLYRKAIDFGLRLGIPSYLSGMLVRLARLLLALGRAGEARDLYGEALTRIASVPGERLAGEDIRFDARVLGLRLRHALGEMTGTEAAAEFRALLLREAAPQRKAALNYELWRLTQDDKTRAAAADFYRSQHAETGVEAYRRRGQELIGETLPDPPPLPDVSELIPERPEDLELASLLAEIENSFD
ncbi:MAG: AAA family ATPase [Anaerolineae bacterium]|nr:AAA family ATPase [Anaerolineae bacterium]